MVISHELLEKTCKNMIETILCCLDHATKGTIYRIGPMPHLRAVRITSGIRDGRNGTICWGLPQNSDYNFPGKTWEQYRDVPRGVLEAMGWCVERQKSWTADNPVEDSRSVRKQLSGQIEDWHHMEPVLVRKDDLYGNAMFDLEYPIDWQGKPIWQDSDYVVVAVIKIHFRPNTIHRGDRSTKIIKQLSRSLGTELFSLHLRETLLKAQEDLSVQRYESYNVLAHELRNILIKFSFISSAINAELSFLREQWEAQLRKAVSGLEDKTDILGRLNRLLQERVSCLNGNRDLAEVSKELFMEQEELAALALLPEKSEQWLNMKIRTKWDRLLSECDVWSEHRDEILRLLDRLQQVLWIGVDETLAERVVHLPEDLRRLWPRLAYIDFSAEKLSTLDEILEFLEHPQLSIPHKLQSRKILSFLKALVEIITEVERRTNNILSSFKNGTECAGSEMTRQPVG